MSNQTEIFSSSESQAQKIDNVEEYQFGPIKGKPMLQWAGKRPFTSTQFFPAQLKETYGDSTNQWLNKVFWGDNLQVMSHLLKEYRGKVDLVYIDPPFDSKADYKKKIRLKSVQVSNDQNSFEEKQYTDLWTNDEYLQFMYERFILLRELLSENGTIFINVDLNKSHYIKIIMDEVFGGREFAEIVWVCGLMGSGKYYPKSHETIFAYRSKGATFNPPQRLGYSKRITNALQKDQKGWYYTRGRESSGGTKALKSYICENPSLSKEEAIKEANEKRPQTAWSVWMGKKELAHEFNDHPVGTYAYTQHEKTGYPTQKPEALLERIIKASTNPGDLVFDCFMGSGTTQAVAMKLGRRFIGADINLGAIETTTKRLINVAKEINEKPPKIKFGEKFVKDFYTGFEVFNVNNYDIFRNPVEAKQILLDALEIHSPEGASLASVYDGEKDGYMVKVMSVNRIATSQDLNELIANLPYKEFEKRKLKDPKTPVENLMIICMGHEPDLKGVLMKEVRERGYKVEVEVVDILRDKTNLEFKRDSEVEVKIEGDQLVIEEFYPMNLLQKLSILKENVEDWREMVESVKIDFNYDGAIFEPTVLDIPSKNELVKGNYKIPEDASTIRIKITDLLSESLETEVENG